MDGVVPLSLSLAVTWVTFLQSLKTILTYLTHSRFDAILLSLVDGKIFHQLQKLKLRIKPALLVQGKVFSMSGIKMNSHFFADLFESGNFTTFTQLSDKIQNTKQPIFWFSSDEAFCKIKSYIYRPGHKKLNWKPPPQF